LRASILTKTGFVGKGSDHHLQLIKFWPSCAPGKGSSAWRKFLAPPYYSQRAVFASLWALFHSSAVNLVQHNNDRRSYAMRSLSIMSRITPFSYRCIVNVSIVQLTPVVFRHTAGCRPDEGLHQFSVAPF